MRALVLMLILLYLLPAPGLANPRFAYFVCEVDAELTSPVFDNLYERLHQAAESRIPFNSSMLRVEGGRCWVEAADSIDIIDAQVLFADELPERIVRFPGFASMDCHVDGCPLSVDSFGIVVGYLDGVFVAAAIPADVADATLRSRLMDR